MRVYVMVGPSGGGKSTWVRQNVPDAVVCSADHHFVGEDGVYRFDPKQLDRAHARCLVQFAEVVAGPGDRPVVVDNTNVSVAEVAPYIALAKAYGWDVRVVVLGVWEDGGDVYANTDLLAARNVHGVPKATIERQLGSFVATRKTWPRFWPVMQFVGKLP